MYTKVHAKDISDHPRGRTDVNCFRNEKIAEECDHDISLSNFSR